jgi:hypothetical protein
MAVLYWRGTVDGDIGNVNNYVTAAGATPGSAPVNNDTLIFDKGSVDVDAGLTSALTGIILRGTSGYSGRIGPSTALSIACASVDWKYSGSLNLTGNITTGKVRCRPGSSFLYQGGTATNLFIDRTPYQIGGSAVVTNLRTFRSDGSDLNNGTQYTLCVVDSGTHVTRRRGVFDLRNGSMLKVKAEGELDDGTIVGHNSTIEYTSLEDIASGDTVEVSSTGKFDASSCPIAFTYDGELAYWPGSKINLVTVGGEVTPGTVTEYGAGDSLDAIPIP